MSCFIQVTRTVTQKAIYGTTTHVVGAGTTLDFLEKSMQTLLRTSIQFSSLNMFGTCHLFVI